MPFCEQLLQRALSCLVDDVGVQSHILLMGSFAANEHPSDRTAALSKACLSFTSVFQLFLLQSNT